MSRMSELALTLDELTEVGQRLVACGEDLIRAAARVKDCFSADEDAEPASAKTPGRRRAAKTPEPEQQPESVPEPEPIMQS